MREGWNVIVRYAPEWRGVSVWLINKSGNREIVVKPVDLELTTTLNPNGEPPEPTFKFYGHDAESFLQSLTEGLVEAGYKPDELKVANQTLEATKYHLEDMRQIAMRFVFPVIRYKGETK